jgi:beta-aspartyl-dipeptidase (metallo-type)
MILIKNAEVYSPKYLGKKDILIGGEKILKISDKITISENLITEEINAENKILIPGLIDGHVHIAGAGGEGGPSSRTPEMKLEKMIEGGITSVIGCLGTDGLTRSPESVLMKVKSLRELGVSAWMWIGSYQVPTPGFFGDPGRDLALIEEIIGAGEISISDHRSSHPTTAELIKLASHVRVGAMLGGKAGIINFHMGDAQDPFRPIHLIVENSELKYKQFLPTHCNRNSYIFEDAKEYGKKGWVDVTASSYPYYQDIEIKPSRAISDLIAAGVPVEHITMTSDANGSLPHFDDEGNLERLEMGDPASIFREMTDCIKHESLGWEKALRTVTSNPANILKLKGKGLIKENFDADLVLLNNELNIESVIARGAFMMKDFNLLRKDTYSKA